MNKILLSTLTAFIFAVVCMPAFAQQSNDDYRLGVLANLMRDGKVAEVDNHLKNNPQDKSAMINGVNLLCRAIELDNLDLFKLFRKYGITTCKTKEENIDPFTYIFRVSRVEHLSTQIFKFLWGQGCRADIMATENNLKYAAKNDINDVFDYIFKNRGKIKTEDATLQKLLYKNDTAGTKLYIKDLPEFLCTYQDYLGAGYIEQKCQELNGEQICRIIYKKGEKSLPIVKNLPQEFLNTMNQKQLQDINSQLNKLINPLLPYVQCSLSREDKNIVIKKAKEVVRASFVSAYVPKIENFLKSAYNLKIKYGVGNKDSWAKKIAEELADLTEKQIITNKANAEKNAFAHAYLKENGLLDAGNPQNHLIKVDEDGYGNVKINHKILGAIVVEFDFREYGCQGSESYCSGYDREGNMIYENRTVWKKCYEAIGFKIERL